MRFWAVYIGVMALAVWLGYRAYVNYDKVRHRKDLWAFSRAAFLAALSVVILSWEFSISSPAVFSVLNYLLLLWIPINIYKHKQIKLEIEATNVLIKAREDELGL